MSDTAPASLVALVEGQSETASINVLLRRLLEREGRQDIELGRPVRFQRSKLVKEGELERFLSIAVRDRAGVAAILVVLDEDDDCAATLGPALLERARSASQLPVAVVFAVREFEAWLLAAGSSLKAAGRIAPEAELPPDPEKVRDAKGRLRTLAPPGRSYVAVADQAAFVSAMDLEEAAGSARSFRKLAGDVSELLKTIPRL